jgi:hypothetical protein
MDGPQKTSFSQRHAFVDRNIVLDLASVTHGNIRADHGVLADIAALPNLASLDNV